MSFAVSASLINKGSNSQGLVIRVSCPSGIQCRASPAEFSSSGTSQITLFTAQNSPVGSQKIEVTGSETHATGLGIFGPLIRTTRSMVVTITVVANHSALAFESRSSFSIRRQTRAITIYDINNDGMNDLIVPNGSSSFAFIRSREGSGTYSELLLTDAPAGSVGGFSPGNFNNDGYVDYAFLKGDALRKA